MIANPIHPAYPCVLNINHKVNVIYIYIYCVAIFIFVQVNVYKLKYMTPHLMCDQ